MGMKMLAPRGCMSSLRLPEEYGLSIICTMTWAAAVVPPLAEVDLIQLRCQYESAYDVLRVIVPCIGKVSRPVGVGHWDEY
ncbi:hypothetical protein ARMSODRAFT_117032 [Armillaria solidipes]|uniref:Uncharacterized protein n=1 Tax=Armillaria solidipes TaxID=1076256 RepID=A0A2H3AXR0_9AGAR|nr:hypothetical protein ARMSODRAFT_117032 [Armillaria solidipes]